MSAWEMEAAQKALRRTDYESDDDDEEQIVLLTGPTPPSTARQHSTPGQSPAISSSFDPYSSTADISHVHGRDNALFDDGSVHTVSSDAIELSTTKPIMASTVPGGAGYLEMEEEPPRHIYTDSEPITTSSGLLLTHRRHSPVARKPVQRPPLQENGGIKTIFDKSDPLTRNGAGFQSVQKDYFEVEQGFFAWKSSVSSEDCLHGNNRRHSMPMLQARRFLSYVRIWMVISAAFLMLATGVLFHAFGHHEHNADSVTFKKDISITTVTQGVASPSAVSGQQQAVSNAAISGVTNQIILVPMENISEFSQRKQNIQQQQHQFPPRQLGYHTHHYQQETKHRNHGVRRLMDFRQEFENWAAHHGKKYHSHEEKERRFNIWSSNHRR